jgi:hypothetical protein
MTSTRSNRLGPPAIEVAGLRKSYGEVEAVRGDTMLALTPPGQELELHLNLCATGGGTCHP